MSIDLEQSRRISTRRLRGGPAVDIYRLPSGGVLFVPVVPDWEQQQQRLERGHLPSRSRSD